MRVIKFDTIKTNAKRQFTALTGGVGDMIGFNPSHSEFLALMEAITLAKPRPPLDILHEWQEYGRRLIDSWDIRCVAKLIELFPNCLPAYCRKLKIVGIGCDENDDWAVSFG